jgi:hypothetical protein
MTSESTLDGNVLVGPLREVFAFEATEAVATCAGCGTRAAVATWQVFVSAPAFVARCRTCGRVQTRVAHAEDGRAWIDLSGVASLEIASHHVG